MRLVDLDDSAHCMCGEDGEYQKWNIDTNAIVGWIPVSEKLPEDKKETYWVCTDTGYQCECRWTDSNLFYTHLKSDWHWNIFDIPQYTKVIAWMPLPEPYEKGE